MFHQHFASILSNAQRPWASDTTSLTSQGQSERKSHRVSPFQTEGMSSHAAHFRHFTWIHSSIKASEAICRACCTIFYYIVSNYRSNMFHLYKNNIKYVYIYIYIYPEKDAVRSPFSTFLGMQCFCYIMFDHLCSYTCDGIARDPHRLSDFLRACQRLPKNVQRVMKIPREKEGGKTNIVCVYRIP